LVCDYRSVQLHQMPLISETLHTRYTYGLRGRQIDVTLLSGLELQEPTMHNQQIYYRHLCTFAFGEVHTRLRPPTAPPPNVSITPGTLRNPGIFT
jgi:hypothetical protein